MKEYLKMGDIFTGAVEQNGSSISDLTGSIGELHGPECYAKYTAHAINSHDELVEMNKQLIDVLKDLLHNSNPPYSGDAEMDAYFEIRYRKISDRAISVITKSKGGAA